MKNCVVCVAVLVASGFLPAVCVGDAITDTIAIIGDKGDGQIGADGTIAGIDWGADRTGTGGNNNRGLALIFAQLREFALQR